MRPLPTSPEKPPAAVVPPTPVAAEGHVLQLKPKTSNNRRTSCPTQRAYPWLLVTSTVMAGVFCFLYLNKPVVVTSASGEADAPFLSAAPDISEKIPKAMASKKATAALSDSLPGDEAAKPRTTEPQNLAGDGNPFEETNLRIQHVIGAQSPQEDDLGRVILDVPVLYQSGTVRWTQDDVEKARSLLTRIGSYQEKSRALREEAIHLISEWDQLIVESIPDEALRADSRTLPENQGIGAADHAQLKTTESIEIEKP